LLCINGADTSPLQTIFTAKQFPLSQPLKDTAMNTHWKSLLIVASVAAIAAQAQAQMNYPTDNYPGMMGARAANPAHMEERINHRLSELKRKLKINASQDAAWATFATAMKPPTTAITPLPDRAEMEKLSTPERIDKMKQLRAQHLEVMKPFMDQRDDAIKTFYASLDTHQKKAFDEEQLHMMRRRHMPW
jgi:hypothetical protein